MALEYLEGVLLAGWPRAEAVVMAVRVAVMMPSRRLRRSGERRECCGYGREGGNRPSLWYARASPRWRKACSYYTSRMPNESLQALTCLYIANVSDITFCLSYDR
jgi:hypothetical protein